MPYLTNWRELRDILNKLSKEKLEDEPRIMDGEDAEIHIITGYEIADNEDNIENGSLFLYFHN